MDHITLREMKLYGYTGCLPEEKQKGQYFYVTVTMFFKEIPAVLTDDLDDTVNYAEVYEIVKDMVSNSRFNLIEHLAHRIGREVISRYGSIDSVQVLIRKPDAPVDGMFESMDTSITVRRREVVIGFGGNMGDCEKNIISALNMIKDNPGIDLVRVSSLYKTEPVGYDDQDYFLNGCALVNTYLEPLELLHELQKIENELHRVRTVKNGPRTIDLDILLFSGMKIDSEELTVPHPRMWQRAFVLVPLKEIGLYNGPIPQNKSVKLKGPVCL